MINDVDKFGGFEGSQGGERFAEGEADALVDFPYRAFFTLMRQSADGFQHGLTGAVAECGANLYELRFNHRRAFRMCVSLCLSPKIPCRITSVLGPLDCTKPTG